MNKIDFNSIKQASRDELLLMEERLQDKLAEALSFTPLIMELVYLLEVNRELTRSEE